MKKGVFLLVVLLLLSVEVMAEKTEEQSIIDEYISIYSEDITKASNVNDAIVNIESIFPNFSAESLMGESASGGSIFDVGGLLERIMSLLFMEMKSALKIMIFVLSLSVLSSYLSALPANENKEVSNVAFYACYIIIAGVCSASFLEIIRCGKDAIDTITLIARIIVPVVIATLTASGAVISASVFQPLLLGIIEIALTIIENIFFPAIILFASLGIISCISEKFNTEKMLQFVGKTIKWGISVLLTIFVGVAGLQSIASGGADGLSVKLAKYAASNLIPVVGGILSETVETVMNCSVIIKNSVGITGIIVMIGAMALPLIKISACLIIFRISAAIIQPITDGRVVKCVSGIADSVGLIFSVTLAVTVMFVIIMTIMLSAGNTAIMLGG